jgi:hypothetical protein
MLKNIEAAQDSLVNVIISESLVPLNRRRCGDDDATNSLTRPSVLVALARTVLDR